MKVFLPLDEEHLPPPGGNDRLVPWQVGYLVLAQLGDGTEVWEWTNLTANRIGKAVQGSNNSFKRSPGSTPSDSAIPAFSSST